MNEPIITLTTDWGTKDFFAGMVKGRLYSKIPHVRIVDITHQITPFDPIAAAFVIKNGCLGFPQNTIHIIDVDTVLPFVIIEYKSQYFICSDNGIPYAVFNDQFTQAVQLNVQRESSPTPPLQSYTFSAYGLFCKVAQLITQDVPILELGNPIQALKQSSPLSPQQTHTQLVAHINYIDSYGNAYLSIKYDEFEKIRNGRKFVLHVSHYDINTISQTYDTPTFIQGRKASLILTISATGHLQIAINKKSVQQLIGLQVHNCVTFSFEDQ